MRQDRKQKDKPAMTLVLGFCLMALVSVMAVKTSIDKINDNMRIGDTAQVVKEQAVDNAKPQASEKPAVVDSLENASGGQSGASKYIMPVNGDIIKEYSMDMPIYWKTLDQYMTHSGIDISSEVGTPVQAIAGGTVTKIEENETMGVTVEINHGNNIISVYSNLTSDGLIELGEVITRGTVIGKVGESSMFEFDDDPHLHFEMLRNGEYVDPRNYIK